MSDHPSQKACLNMFLFSKKKKRIYALQCPLRGKEENGHNFRIIWRQEIMGCLFFALVNVKNSKIISNSTQDDKKERFTI